MPTFQSIIGAFHNPQENLEYCRQVIDEITSLTGRPLLVYAADFYKDSAIRPEDKTGFSDIMECVDAQDVDIFVHSPGGMAEVTESIVGMLRPRYRHIRFAIPNMAKSAATLLCMAGDELLMDHRSELGPVDPQLEYGAAGSRRMEAAEDILDGFNNAKDALVAQGPAAIPAYVPLLSGYTIALLAACENAMKLSRQLTKSWLTEYMFSGMADAETKATTIAEYFASHSDTLSHSRPIMIDKCIEVGLKVVDMRQPEHRPLGNKLWELWCAYEFLFERTGIKKIYQNSCGGLLTKQQMLIALPQQPPPPAQPQPTPPAQEV